MSSEPFKAATAADLAAGQIRIPLAEDENGRDYSARIEALLPIIEPRPKRSSSC